MGISQTDGVRIPNLPTMHYFKEKILVKKRDCSRSQMDVCDTEVDLETGAPILQSVVQRKKDSITVHVE